MIGIFLERLALPGKPYDGHILREVIEDTQKLTGCAIERGYVDKGYRGHDTENPRRIFISGQKPACPPPSNASCDDAPPSSR
jgi:IS5 family transposase